MSTNDVFFLRGHEHHACMLIGTGEIERGIMVLQRDLHRME